MVNGAVTLGTLDGANIEIVEEAGKENAFIFGLTKDEIITIENEHSYNPQKYLERNPQLAKIMNQLIDVKEPDKETRIVVMEIKPSEDSLITFGAIADSVQEVIDIEDSEIEPPPKFGNNISGKFIHGIGRKNGNFIIILNINQIFSADEIINLTEITQSLNEAAEET